MTFELPLMSDPLWDRDTSIKTHAADFARTHVASFAESWERDGAYPTDPILFNTDGTPEIMNVLIGRSLQTNRK